jgi:hypothetical protein
VKRKGKRETRDRNGRETNGVVRRNEGEEGSEAKGEEGRRGKRGQQNTAKRNELGLRGTEVKAGDKGQTI